MHFWKAHLSLLETESRILICFDGVIKSHKYLNLAMNYGNVIYGYLFSVCLEEKQKSKDTTLIKDVLIYL